MYRNEAKLIQCIRMSYQKRSLLLHPRAGPDGLTPKQTQYKRCYHRQCTGNTPSVPTSQPSQILPKPSPQIRTIYPRRSTSNVTSQSPSPVGYGTTFISLNDFHSQMITNCLIEHPETPVCLKCMPGFLPDLYHTSCGSCSSVENCAICKPIQGKLCARCIPGFVTNEDSNTCIAYSGINCRIANVPDICMQCAAGYFLSHNNCDCPRGCLACTISGNTKICQECHSTYLPTPDHACSRDCANIPYCAQCDIFTRHCSACKQGFALVNGMCLLCGFFHFRFQYRETPVSRAPARPFPTARYARTTAALHAPAVFQLRTVSRAAPVTPGTACFVTMWIQLFVEIVSLGKLARAVFAAHRWYRTAYWAQIPSALNAELEASCSAACASVSVAKTAQAATNTPTVRSVSSALR
uniref:Cysteine-rich membrane protein 2 n=1 Tax=Spironucleus salmonicida TaxID=348837 RepID=V6LQB2_9EUKA|eukprot:EST46770.1 hypothetical protein SS50377_13196 [Spironucleus salmonicida]